ncbi:MAG: family efflux transporter [Paenibacillaceae bacterium]|jgi:putative MATE family efflux protein|nr:family efflux transporter [Paenibacillaceae bacterium]
MSRLSLQKEKLRPEGLLNKYFSGESMNYRQIIALFIPILIDQMFVVGLNLLNTAMISSSGMEAVSAVNMVDSLNMFLVNVFIAVATGGTVVVAQYKGSGNPQMVSKSAASAIASVTLIAMAVSTLVIALHNPIIQLLFGTASPGVLDNARIYLIGSGLSFTGIGIVQAVCGALRGIGKTRESLFLSLITNVTYVLLNLVLITLLDMGVEGMTIAVNAARYIGAACALFYLFKKEETMRIRVKEMFHIQGAMLKKIMFIGVPFAAEQMFFNGGKLLTQIFIVGMGTYATAANAIGGTIAGLSQIPSGAMSLTIVTVVGQCVGRRDIADARKFIKSFIWLSSLSLLGMTLLILPLFGPLVSLFGPPDEIMHDLFLLTLINLLAQIPLWSISFITPAALRAAGDSKFTSIVAMLSMWLFRVVLGYILGVALEFGVIGVWLAMNCEWGVRGTIFLLRFRGQKWYKHKLI